MRLEPYHSKEGEIQGYDIYVDDVWHGSRRTIEFCEHVVSQLKPKKKDKK